MNGVSLVREVWRYLESHPKCKLIAVAIKMATLVVSKPQ